MFSYINEKNNFMRLIFVFRIHQLFQNEIQEVLEKHNKTNQESGKALFDLCKNFF